MAARLDPADGRLRGLVDWRALPPAETHRVVVADATSLWVQQGDLLARIDDDGLRRTVEVPGLELRTAGGPGAWLAPPWYSPVGDAFHDPTGPPLPPGRLVLIEPDGRRRDLVVDRPVAGVCDAEADGLRLGVQLSPATNTRHPSGYVSHDHHQVSVQVPWSALHTSPVTVADRHAEPALDGGSHGWLQLTRPGWQLGDLTWRFGNLPEDEAFDKQIVVTAHRPDHRPYLRLTLGAGRVVGHRFAHGRLWLVLARRTGFAVVTIEPDRGEPTVVRPHDDPIDITDRCWSPPAAPPPGFDAHARAQLELLSGLDRWGRTTDHAGPLVPGMADAVAVLVGAWPHLEIHVTFRHPWYPEGRLRRRFPIVDELGRPIPSTYADIGLMEDLTTGNLPSASAAVDGILEI